MLREISVSLEQLVAFVSKPEKKNSPGASRRKIIPTIIAMRTYTNVVMAMARNVPLGMAVWGFCGEGGWMCVVYMYMYMYMNNNVHRALHRNKEKGGKEEREEKK